MGSHVEKHRTHHRRKETSESSSSSSDSDSSARESRRRMKSSSRRRERDKQKRKKKSTRTDDDDDDVKEADTGRAQKIVKYFLNKFPDVANDLKQILQMIDDGQAVDLSEICNDYLVKLLQKLFHALRLKKHKNGAYFLSSKACLKPMDVVGYLFPSTRLPEKAQMAPNVTDPDAPIAESSLGAEVPTFQVGRNQVNGEDLRAGLDSSSVRRIIGPQMPPAEVMASARKLIGPQMPPPEVLAAAAKLNEDYSIRSEGLELDGDDFIGPPPPTIVAEAESVNEAERFEEVSRITVLNIDNPYEVLGLNRKALSENIRKRYWKLSLLVHPDKCSHPEAQQAFVLLNQAFKLLQDTQKRKEVDDKLIEKEEREEFEAELQAHREAARWRQIRGESLPGDDELLAGAKLEAKRDEWMTELPPERKAGTSMHSTTFSKGGKEGRGDTSAWTDTPIDRAQKASARVGAIGNSEAANAVLEPRVFNAESVDAFNSSRRSKSLMQKHVEEERSRGSSKKKQKKMGEEEWVGKHPWKPWNRETDLSAGRQKVQLDPEGMQEGLSSRFSSGSFQRNFL